MKSLQEIKDELLKLGATARLSDLNKERELLLKILTKDAELKNKINKHIRKKYIRKGKHWTQLPKNRAKLMAMTKKAAEARKANE